MNIDENMDDLKHYVGTTCILEPWNPPTLWRNVSYLTMLNFDADMCKWKEFQCWPLSLLNVRRRWIMALVMGLLEDVPWHFKRVSTKITLMGMENDYNEIAWWTLMKTWTITNIMPAWYAYLSFENDSVDGNDEWWQWDCMMNIDENVDDLKGYVGTPCIL